MAIIIMVAYSVSASAQGRQRSEDGEAIAWSQVRLRQDV